MAKPGDPAFDTSSLVTQTLRALSVPRLTGSAGWRQTTRHVRDALVSLGYDVTDHTFAFSNWPGRFGPPLVGILVSGGLGATWLTFREGMPYIALAILISTQIATVLLITASERFLLRFPRGRMEGVNILARAGAKRPRWIIVAHRDSKSQLVPIALRIAAAAVAGIVWLLMLGGILLAIFNVNTLFTAFPVAAPGIAAGFVLILCVTGNDSAGALDNASGVAALLGIAAGERGSDDVAFLVTDAEEFGLAGASAIAGSLAWAEAVINLDGLDDHGPFRVLGRYGTPRRGGAPQIETALRAAAADADLPLRASPVPRGLLLDHLAFARAGIPALTVMRGTWISMARVHRPGDRLERLDGDGVLLTVDLVRDALARLRTLAPASPGH
jgi:hypothetical protein